MTTDFLQFQIDHYEKRLKEETKPGGRSLIKQTLIDLKNKRDGHINIPCRLFLCVGEANNSIIRGFDGVGWY